MTSFSGLCDQPWWSPTTITHAVWNEYNRNNWLRPTGACIRSRSSQSSLNRHCAHDKTFRSGADKIERITGDESQHSVSTRVQGTGIRRGDNASIHDPIQIELPTNVNSDLIAYCHILQHAKMSVPMSCDHRIAGIAWHGTSEQMPRPFPQGLPCGSFHDIKRGVLARK